MQQPTHPMAPISPASITTEQIQKYLDENKQLILAILDNQNLGKLAECAQYQAQLQKNLLFLAAIADAQPPTPSVRPQMIPQPMMQQQGGPFGQQVSAFPPRPAMQFNTPQIYEQRPQHQPQLMPFPGHMSLRPGVINGLHSMHAAQISQGGRSDLPPGSAMSELPRGSTPSSSSMEGQVSKLDTRKQTVADSATTSVADGQRSSATEHGVGEVAEAPTYQKRSEDSKTS
ncbi:hypothetical protein HPP92_009219 [Vanilla planifolia]|uniref:SS18 N-terminal domain-containing protein n=1 Tax=Vanilla planifolia TaxID=51239 RepID=A0A835R6J1_VANPL|nr:hypothetical protein HPP92_009423 [Vanilla planifolia]KAG0487124.1 hypothetical protein HPP92_009219 [Vanilla planifolia]